MFAFAALTIGYVVATLQLIRVLRGHTLGVAPLTWGMIGVLSAGWATFYLNLGEYWVALGTIMFSPLAMLIALLCSTNKKRAAALLVASLTAVIATVFFAPTVGEPVLSLVAASMLIPQMLVALKAYWNKTSVDGISITAWILNLSVAVLWFTQGIIFSAPEMMFANGILFITGIPIIFVASVQPKRLAAQAAQGTEPGAG